MDPFTIATYRFVGIALPALSIIIYRNEDPFPRGKRLVLIARSVMGASNLIIFFYGYIIGVVMRSVHQIHCSV